MVLAFRLLSPLYTIQNPCSWWTYLLTSFKVNRITPQVTSQVIPDLTKLTAEINLYTSQESKQTHPRTIDVISSAAFLCLLKDLRAIWQQHLYVDSVDLASHANVPVLTHPSTCIPYKPQSPPWQPSFSLAFCHIYTYIYQYLATLLEPPNKPWRSMFAPTLGTSFIISDYTSCNNVHSAGPWSCSEHVTYVLHLAAMYHYVPRHQEDPEHHQQWFRHPDKSQFFLSSLSLTFPVQSPESV